MKKLILICFTFMALSLFTNAQQSNWSENAKEQIQGKGRRMTPEDRAKKQTREMSKSLKLDAQQEQQIEQALLAFHKEMASQRQSAGKSFEEMNQSEREEMKSKHLSAQNELSSEMKNILNEEQFATYTEKMGEWQRKMRKRRRQGKN